ncbi:hypothetical protein C5D98_14820 [Rathayibacter rathayi]|nr:hypothetical protein C5C15_09165 [Rathayibacter rathayi]PPI65222.1 hypothetical protein C5D98_14820 [Rathayibacter rathayi]
MAFIITVDHIPDETAEPGTNQNARGVIGPRDATAAQVEQLAEGKGEPFRMFDDDGELYYEGRFLGNPNPEEADAEEQFEPLDCFGLPNAGAVRIEYRNAAGEWETL